MSQTRSILRSALAILSSNVGSLALSFLTGIILARSLGPENRGIFAALTAYPALVTAFGQIGIRQATVYLVAQGKHGEKEIAGVVASLWILSSLLGAFACLLLTLPTLRIGADWTSIALAIALVPVLLMNYFSGGYLLGKERIGDFVKLRYVPAAATLLLTLLFVALLHWGVAGGQLAQLIGTMFATVTVSVGIMKTLGVRFSWNGKIAKDILSLGIVYGVALLLNQLVYKTSILFLQFKGTTEEMGHYALASQLGELIWQIPNAVGLVIYARRSRAEKQSQTDRDFRFIFLLTVAVAGFCCIVAALVGPYMIPLIYSPSFTESSDLLKLLLPGVLAMTACRVLGFDMAGQGKPWLSIVAAIPALLVSIPLNMFLIPRYGASGAAVSCSISYIVMAGVFGALYNIRSVGPARPSSDEAL